jgi:hypothetical protein
MRFNDLGNGRVEYVKYTPNSAHTIHVSLPGEPWQRTKELRKQLQEDLKSANSSQKKEIDSKLQMLDKGNNKSHACLIHLQPVTAYYPYAQANRFHFYDIHYKGKCGDLAKTAILETLIEQVNNCQNQHDLDELKSAFFKSLEYKILKTSQGITSKLFGITTDSVKAVEHIFSDAQYQLTQHLTFKAK